MVRPASDLYVLSASLADFLIPNRLHSLWRPQSFTWPGNQIAPLSERTLALGYVALALAGVALLHRRRQAAFWAVTALFFLLLALGPALHAGNITQADVPVDLLPGANAPGWTPFAALNRWVPFMRISRSVSRYALMVQLCVALLAGMGLHVLTRRLRSGGGRRRSRAGRGAGAGRILGRAVSAQPAGHASILCTAGE